MTYPTRIYSTARSRLAGSTQAAIENEINDTITEVCETVPAWVEHWTTVTSTAVTSYVPAAPSQSAIVYILSVELDNRPIAPWSGYKVAPSERNIADLRDPATVKLMQAPPDGGALAVAMQLKPVWQSPPDLPPILLDRHHTVLLDGVLARMYGHQDRPYTDFAKAEEHQRAFDKNKRAISDAFRRGRTMHSRPWVYPPFASGSQRGRKWGWGL